MFDDTCIECRMVSSIAFRASGEGLLWCKHYIIYIEYSEAQQSTYYVQLYCASPCSRLKGGGISGNSIRSQYWDGVPWGGKEVNRN
jgi:hypothetical protein